MIMKRIIYLLLIIVLPEPNITAQTVYKNQVRIENQSITRNEDNRLTIAMDIVMQSNMRISSNHAAILTPILEAKGYTKALPAILVYGRKRALVNGRNNDTPKDAYTIIRRKRKTEQRVSYLIQIPYEKWMRQANLVMDADLCGCRDIVEAAGLDPITTLNIVPPKPETHIAYITPAENTATKQRSIEGKAYLDFPVNKTEIQPNYRNNRLELATIRATIDTVQNDKYSSITNISIEGFASPEGSYASNARLAQGRALALMNYVRGFYHFPEEMTTVSSTPEDWVGFRQFIASSDMDKKEQILVIMDSNESNFDKKEYKIRALIGATAYKRLLAECYPALRHSDYRISYTIRSFNLEEIKALLHTSPQYLSLKEIYKAAQSYEPGSEAFNDAFLVAVTLFPNDATANLNAASMEIQRGGDMTAAKKYLKKADPKQGATLNNLGVVALQENDLEAASDYLKRAQAAGCKEAELNLQELAKLIDF